MVKGRSFLFPHLRSVQRDTPNSFAAFAVEIFFFDGRDSDIPGSEVSTFPGSESFASTTWFAFYAVETSLFLFLIRSSYVTR